MRRLGADRHLLDAVDHVVEGGLLRVAMPDFRNDVASACSAAKARGDLVVARQIEIDDAVGAGRRSFQRLGGVNCSSCAGMTCASASRNQQICTTWVPVVMLTR